MAATKEATILYENYLYISHLDEDYKFWLLPATPDSVSDAMQSTYQSTNALGRSAPVYTFSNAGPRTVNISLKIHRDMMDEVNMGVSNAKLGIGEDYIDNLLNALRAASLPRYNLSNKAVEPPLVALRIGNEFFIRGVLSQAISLTYNKPLLRNGKFAEVTFSIVINEVDPYSADEVFKEGGFRGVVNSFRTGMNLEEN